MRGLAGLGDILTFGLSDFDRQGGGIGGMATGLGYDVKITILIFLKKVESY